MTPLFTTVYTVIPARLTLLRNRPTAQKTFTKSIDVRPIRKQGWTSLSSLLGRLTRVRPRQSRTRVRAKTFFASTPVRKEPCIPRLTMLACLLLQSSLTTGASLQANFTQDIKMRLKTPPISFVVVSLGASRRLTTSALVNFRTTAFSRLTTTGKFTESSLWQRRPPRTATVPSRPPTPSPNHQLPLRRLESLPGRVKPSSHLAIIKPPT